MRASNGDTDRTWKLPNGESVVGLGSFHKTLEHNDYGEVCKGPFDKFKKATRGDGSGFAKVPPGPERQTGKGTADFTNPQAGLAADRLTHHPASYSIPPAPTVLSVSTAAEMTELYWMAVLRDKPFNAWSGDAEISAAVGELDTHFAEAVADTADAGHLTPGIDLPGSASARAALNEQNLFRMGLPGDEYGPLLSQFFVRPVHFGTQMIQQTQRPYKAGENFLTTYDDWLKAQDSGKDENDQAYPKSNEHSDDFFETHDRYIGTMRDLARFVNKDALHQAYFNAALLMLSGDAKWNPGNPYRKRPLSDREAGFGTLGGPHILSLVSEVATRALKIVWNQKWQVHLRLRPEAYGGLVHVQNIGVKVGKKVETRAYGLPSWVHATQAAGRVKDEYGGYLLPMAFTAGSPTHPAYGAGHATVAGACVTVLKAYFETIGSNGKPILFGTLKERKEPYGPGAEIKAYVTGELKGVWDRFELPANVAAQLTIEGELNKLAVNVAMGRTMGGVHWRSDNTRSLMLGEAIAAEILADITTDLNEKPSFTFRTFARRADGKPRKVRIENGRIFVDGVLTDSRGRLF